MPAKKGSMSGRGLKKARDRLKRVPGLGFFAGRTDLLLGAKKHFAFNTASEVRKLKQSRDGWDYINTFSERKIGNFRTGIAGGHAESPVAIYLMLGSQTLWHLNIGFGGQRSRRILNIYAIQGWEGRQKKMAKFEKGAGMPAPNFLVKEAVRHARIHNFKEVRILRPEFNKTASPVIMRDLARAYPEFAGPEVAAKLEAMMHLYYDLAKKEGFKKEGKWFVKKL